MAKRSTEDVGVNMTPMIDIVFQLIIFFVVTTELDKKVFDNRIILAMAPDGQAIEEIDPRTVTVDVHKNGTVSIARNDISLPLLTTILRNARARAGNTTPVHIRGDRDTEHEYIRRVMDACGQAGIWRVSFVALKEKAERPKR